MSDEQYEVGAAVALRGEHSQERIEDEDGGLIEYRPVTSDRLCVVVGHEGRNRLGVRHVVRFVDDDSEATCDFTELVSR